MSDETMIESAASPEVQAEAAKVGWKGPDQFKGDPEKFVDADEYLKRAETVLPFVRDQNRRLSTDLADLRARLEAEVAKNSAISKRMEDIDIEHSTQLAKQFKKAKEEAQAELEAALEAGDHKATARLTREVAALEQVEDQPVVKKSVTEERPQLSPEDQAALAAWNAWADEQGFATWSKREQREFRLIGEDLRREGNRNVGKLFAEDIMREMKRETKVDNKGDSKVEGGKGSGSPRGSAKSGYAALTPEERAVCDADSRNFVGKGKRFETQDAYRAHWAKVYQEQA